MTEFYIVFPYLFAHFLILIMPGPDFLIVTRNALNYSRSVGIFTAIGIALGFSVHVLYSLLGVSLIISQSDLLFNIIKYMGALYLLYIAWQSFFSHSQKLDLHNTAKQKEISNVAAFKIGFLTNLLNPKVILFFLSFFTAMLSESLSQITIYLVAICMIITTFLWFLLVTIFFTQKPIQEAFYKYQNVFNKMLALILVFFAYKLFFSSL